ncbi:MAG: hypothetical protein ABSB63_08960 [Spirochaetia bacterium]|jgi:hypothetical protein
MKIVRIPGLLGLLVLLGVAVACGPFQDTRPSEVDLCPPQLQAVFTTGPSELSVEFDEDATLVPDKTKISPPLAITEITGPGKRIVIRGESQTPGRLYTLEAEAEDAKGNRASFMADFYGYNGRVPRLLINEFTTQGSGNHPDVVELKALTAGSMGGVVLFQGTPSSFDNRIVFPPLEVAQGAFILVHCRPSGDPAEMNETEDMTASKGFDASDSAWDLWIADGKGLSGNNGVLSLYDRPGGKCLDGVLYSNRTSQSDELYRGFGSEETLNRAEELVLAGGWRPAGARVSPEDAVNPEGSTGTRSICRSSSSADTDSAEDWHIVPTRKATFGAENSDEVYAP